MREEAAKVEWLDSMDIRYNEDFFSLWGEEHATLGHATDIYQGSIGNCWFMQGASSVAMKESRLESIFYNTQLSNNGIYAVKLYVLGVPTTITVDDSIPTVGGNSIFGNASKDGALWGIVLEKAFAKLHGNYESIEGGQSKHSVGVLIGAPSEPYHHNSNDAAALWTAITQAVANGNMITAGTPGGDDTSRSARGIAQGHGYTVLNAVEVNGNKLVRVRNPWGKENYSGPWNDNDTSKWDESI